MSPEQLFSFNMPGAGYHITGHMLGLIALIIAIFAVCGYISFRNDSVPESALKGNDEFVLLANVAVAADAADSVFTFTQPANTFIKSIYCVVDDAITIGGDNDMNIGTTLGGAELMLQQLMFSAGVNPIGSVGSSTTFVAAGANWTSAARTLYGTLDAAAAATEAGSVNVYAQYVYTA